MRTSQIAVRALVGSCAGVLLAWAAFWAANTVLLHGLSTSCSTGSPDFDPRHCGITWQPGLPYVGAALLGVAVGARWFWRLMLVAGGTVTVLTAVGLLWTDTWRPDDPRFVEPAGPQLVLLTAGITATVGGVLIRARPRAATVRTL